MKHVAFTLEQHALIEGFPTSHRFGLRTRIVLDPEETEEIAELYARDPDDVAYVVAAMEDGAIEVMRWPQAELAFFETLEAALDWVIQVEKHVESNALRLKTL